MTLLTNLLQTPIVLDLGRTLLHAVWQGTATGVILALLLRVLRGASPRLRYGLAIGALANCLALPLLTFSRVDVGAYPSTSPPPTLSVQTRSTPVSVLPEELSPVAITSTPTAIAPQASEQRETWQAPGSWRRAVEPLLPWMVALWFLGVVLLSVRLTLALHNLHRLRTNFVRPVPTAVQSLARQSARALGLRQPVQVFASRLADVPMVVGYVRPIVLLPASALTGLSPAQLEMILAHELAHIRRLDPLVNLLQHLAETLLFFNPAVWWISEQVRQERECCCDLLAVQACGGDRVAYARALFTLDAIRPPAPLALAADGGSLLGRIIRLTGTSTTAPTRPGHFLAGAILITVSLLIASIATAQAQGGILRIAYASIQQLDPYTSANNDEINAFSQVFDPLIVIGKNDFQPIPHLAESWESPDDTTWVFHLRQGVTFQDGNDVFPEGANRELVADDVVYSINRFLEVSTAFTLGDIASVTALDPYTVEIKTAAPDPFLVTDPNRLARVVIVPREAVEQLGDEDFARNPIGSGPFELVSFTPDQELEFTRNEDYWLPVNLDGVTFTFIPDPTVQTIALESGEVDVIAYIFNIDSVAQLSENPDLTLIERGGSYRGLGFNVTTPPFDEFAVRDAISKAIDIDAAVQAIIAPFGERAYGQVPPWTSFTRDPELQELWTYDPDAALAELAEAGFTDSDGDGILDRDGEPLSFNIKTIAGSQVRVLTILVTQLKELGIDANILQQDTAVWADDLQTGNDTGLFFDYSFAGTTGLYSLFHSSNNGRTNTHFYTNPDVDALLDEASSTLDFETRNDLWLQAQRLIMQDRAVIPLYFENGYSVVSNKVNDFVPPWGGLSLVSTENNVSLSE